MRRGRGFWISAAALAALILFVTGGPRLSPYGEAEQDLRLSYARPSAAHWLGCDGLGRDLMTRVLYGGRISLAVGAAGALVSLLLGVTIGGAAGLAGGWTER